MLTHDLGDVNVDMMKQFLAFHKVEQVLTFGYSQVFVSVDVLSSEGDHRAELAKSTTTVSNGATAREEGEGISSEIRHCGVEQSWGGLAGVGGEDESEGGARASTSDKS
ncbi:hypothetical protein GUJ93_ZPchr0007g3908 [Zizania palustris]|uniref:Uncharacterized protein n=1 Tax=Zizania palustris TaxID=103762 RepID=A0A8J5SS62_ZIZPA|nr:hypothetical protein GUJ93_ZPchr0007g3908 [Zizania palustris]